MTELSDIQWAQQVLGDSKVASMAPDTSTASELLALWQRLPPTDRELLVWAARLLVDHELPEAMRHAVRVSINAMAKEGFLILQAAKVRNAQIDS